MASYRPEMELGLLAPKPFHFLRFPPIKLWGPRHKGPKGSFHLLLSTFLPSVQEVPGLLAWVEWRPEVGGTGKHRHLQSFGFSALTSDLPKLLGGRFQPQVLVLRLPDSSSLQPLSRSSSRHISFSPREHLFSPMSALPWHWKGCRVQRGHEPLSFLL